MGKIGRSREFIATGDYDPGDTRIPLKRLQELRGELGHCYERKNPLATETPYVGRLLRAKNGALTPNASLRDEIRCTSISGTSLNIYELKWPSGG